MKTYNGMTYKYVKDEWKGSTRNEVYFEEHEYGLWKNININEINPRISGTLRSRIRLTISLIVITHSPT